MADLVQLKEFNKTITSPRMQEWLSQVLHERKGTFVNNVTALVNNDAKLQVCEPMGLICASLKATALNFPLDASLGLAYVLPYRNGKTGKTEAQFQLGYKGIIQLALRSGQIRTINATDVRAGEFSGINMLTGEFSLTQVADRGSKPVTGYAAYMELTNGFYKAIYMSRAEVEAHAKRYSMTYRSSNSYTRAQSKWTTDFDKMAKKTVLKQLLTKYAPLSVEFNSALQADQSVIGLNERGTAETYNYVDNDPHAAANSVGEMAAAAAKAQPAEVVDVEASEDNPQTEAGKEATA